GLGAVGWRRAHRRPRCDAGLSPRAAGHPMSPAIVLAFMLAPPAASSALMQSPTAIVEGTIVDSSGQVVPGAAVDLRDAATNQVRRTVSDDRGAFRFVALAPGTYDVGVQLEGFAPFQQQHLTLAIGATSQLTIRLAPAAISQTMTVTAQPPSLNVSQTSVATVIDPERIEELPVRSRNYLEFALLAPGVSRAQPSSQATPGAALPDSGFSFGGLRPRSNTLTIDGLDNNDAFNGGSRTELSLEIVREFAVQANGWSAERGGASGGAINVVTKSGANILHGDAFLFAQNGALNAKPFLEETGSTKPSLTRYRGGLAAGGPLVKDRTFYYAAGERERMHDHRASDVDPDAVSRINQSSASSGMPDSDRVTSGLFPVDLKETELSAKLTHQANPRHALTARLAGTTTDDAGDAFNAAGLADAASRGRRQTMDIAGTGSWT